MSQEIVDQSVSHAFGGFTTATDHVAATDPLTHLGEHRGRLPSAEALATEMRSKVHAFAEAVHELRAAVQGPLNEAGATSETDAPDNVGSSWDLAQWQSAIDKLQAASDLSGFINKYKAMAEDGALHDMIRGQHDSEGGATDVESIRGAIDSLKHAGDAWDQRFAFVSEVLRQQEGSASEEVHKAINHLDAEMQEISDRFRHQVNEVAQITHHLVEHSLG